MRVALVNLTGGGLSGGYRKYLEIVPPLLAGQPGVERLEILSPASMKHRLAPGISEWRWPDADARHGYRALRSRLDASRYDVVFFPTARIVRSAIPSVVMVRNMEPLVAPFAGNSLADGVRNIARRLAAHRSTARATRVIAVSDFVRDFLVERWGMASDRIGVVPHGIESPLPETDWVRPEAAVAREGEAVLFTAGSIRPARGLEDLVHALETLSAQGRRPTLWVAGTVAGAATRYHEALRRRLADRGLAEQVRWLGGLTRREMSWCFGNCDLFVMTSRVEACPNTALEAMSHGVLSVATSNRPMPETFAGSADFYPAGDGFLLADSIARVLELGAADRARRSAIARTRAADYSWERAAEGTVRELRLARRADG